MTTTVSNLTRAREVLYVDDPVAYVREHPEQSFSIAASAGCGKTYILVQRVLSLLEHGVPIDKLLLLTFTENAAREMRTRLLEALSDVSDQPWAHASQEKMAFASIQTINSFALDVCSAYFDSAGLGQQASIVDDARFMKLFHESFSRSYNAWGDDPIHNAFFKAATAVRLDRKKMTDIYFHVSRHVPHGFAPEEFDYVKAGSKIFALMEQESELLSDAVLSYATRLLTESICTFRKERFEKGLISHDESLSIAAHVFSHEPIRFEIWKRYDSILVDEFQDTDDMQMSMVKALADDDQQENIGRLFVVGDTKQSIYGFRGVQVDSYNKFVNESDATALGLDRSYRTYGSILSVVNDVMDKLFDDYVEMKWAREEEPSSIARISYLGEAMSGSSDEIRKASAHDIARGIKTFVTNGSTYGDIAVLVRNKNGVAAVARACKENNIAYLVDSSQALWEMTYTKILLAVIAAICDPRDHVAIIAALKSPLFGCTNEELGIYVQERGREYALGKHNHVDKEQYAWNYMYCSGSGRVYEALQSLHELHRVAQKATPTELMHHALYTQGMHQTFLHHDASASSVSKYLTSLALYFQDSYSPHTCYEFARYLKNVRNQSTPPVTYVADSGIDAVRIMTMHKSKGLEFPIVFVAPDIGDSGNKDVRAISLETSASFTPEDSALYFSSDLYDSRLTGHIEKRKDERRQEETRLLYVAMTRARDYLVLCMHDKEVKKKSPSPTGGVKLLTYALEASGAFAKIQPLILTENTPHISEKESDASRTPVHTEAWDELSRVIERQKVISPSSLEEQEIEQSYELSPLRRITQPGVAHLVGTATHRALNIVSFSGDSREIDALALACARDAGVADRFEHVATNISRALSYELIRNADPRSLREAPVSGELAGHLVEGYIDLLIYTEDGWIIVDYKTDSLAKNTMSSKVEKYAPQLRAYKQLLEDTHGLKIAGTYLLFLDIATDGLIAVDPA